MSQTATVPLSWTVNITPEITLRPLELAPNPFLNTASVLGKAGLE